MNNKILFSLCLLAFYQCDWNNLLLIYDEKIDPNDYEVAEIGMLRVLLPEDCFIEDCGPRYSLLNDSLKISEILIGDFDKNHSDLIVQVFGKNKYLTAEERKLINYYGPIDTALYVEKYGLISYINYHSFLVSNARLYTTQKYGCFIPWNKSFSWKTIGGIPYIGVRMTNTFADSIPFPFIEIWYNAKNGKFENEINSLDGMNPCKY